MMRSNMNQIAIYSGHVRATLRVPRDVEIFFDKLGPGLRDHVTALTL